MTGSPPGIIRPINVRFASSPSLEIPETAPLESAIRSGADLTPIIQQFLDSVAAAQSYLQKSTMEPSQKKAHLEKLRLSVKKAYEMTENTTSSTDELQDLRGRLLELFTRQQGYETKLIAPNALIGKPERVVGSTATFSTQMRRTRTYPSLEKDPSKITITIDLEKIEKAIHQIKEQTHPDSVSRVELSFRIYQVALQQVSSARRELKTLNKIEKKLTQMLKDEIWGWLYSYEFRSQDEGDPSPKKMACEALQRFIHAKCGSLEIERKFSRWQKKIGLLIAKAHISAINTSMRLCHKGIFTSRETTISGIDKQNGFIKAWEERLRYIRESLTELFPDVPKRLQTLKSLSSLDLDEREEIIDFFDPEGAMRLGAIMTDSRLSRDEKIHHWEKLSQRLKGKFRPENTCSKFLLTTSKDKPSSLVQQLRSEVDGFRLRLGDRRFFRLAFQLGFSREDLGDNAPKVLSVNFFALAFGNICSGKQDYDELVIAFKVFSIKSLMEMDLDGSLQNGIAAFGLIEDQIKYFVRHSVFSNSSKEGIAHAFNGFANTAFKLACEGEMNTPIAILAGLELCLRDNRAVKLRNGKPFKNLEEFLKGGLAKQEKDLKENPKGPLLVPSIANHAQLLSNALEGAARKDKGKIVQDFSNTLFEDKVLLQYWSYLSCPKGLDIDFLKPISLRDEFVLGIYDPKRIGEMTQLITRVTTDYFLSLDSSEVHSKQDDIKYRFEKCGKVISGYFLGNIMKLEASSIANLLIGLGHLGIDMKRRKEFNGAAVIFNLLFEGELSQKVSGMEKVWSSFSKRSDLPFEEFRKSFSTVDEQKVFVKGVEKHHATPFLPRLFSDLTVITDDKLKNEHVKQYQDALRRNGRRRALPGSFSPLFWKFRRAFQKSVRKLSLQEEEGSKPANVSEYSPRNNVLIRSPRVDSPKRRRRSVSMRDLGSVKRDASPFRTRPTKKS